MEVFEKQRQFLQSTARTVIYRCGIRSGKTVALIFKALQFAISKRRFCVVSFSYPALRDVDIWTLKRICISYGIKYTENKSEKIIEVYGSEILFRSGDQPDSLRGLSLDGFGIDEAREFSDRTIYDILIGRLSQSENAQGYIVTSPKGRNWAFDLEGKPDTETIIQATHENIFLPENYVTSLESAYTTQFARQELNAEIVQFGTGLIDRKWFPIIPPQRPIKKTCRYWDLAVSAKTNADFSVGTLMSIDNGKVILHHVDRCKLEYPELRKRIIARALEDGPSVTIGIEEVAAMKAIVDDLKRDHQLSQHVIRPTTPRGDKFSRAMPWISRAQLGSISVCQGSWNNDFFDEAEAFSGDGSHQHDDQIDSVSGGYSLLTNVGTMGMLAI